MSVESIAGISGVNSIDGAHIGAPISHHAPAIGTAPPPDTIAAAAAAALREATETPAETAAEARAGDPVAIKKLHDEQLHANAPEPGKGEVIDRLG